MRNSCAASLRFAPNAHVLPRTAHDLRESRKSWCDPRAGRARVAPNAQIVRERRNPCAQSLRCATTPSGDIHEQVVVKSVAGSIAGFSKHPFGVGRVGCASSLRAMPASFTLTRSQCLSPHERGPADSCPLRPCHSTCLPVCPVWIRFSSYCRCRSYAASRHTSPLRSMACIQRRR